jgi:hypothetical protein
LSLYGPFNGSPQLQATPYSLASSHGSSFDSYGENGALGSSFGSYGDGTGMSVSYPAALNGQMSLLGGSPDTNWRRLSGPHMQGGLGQAPGQTQLGMSPSGGGCRSLSLGGSPSHQFPAQGPHFPVSPGSQYTASPGSQYQTSGMFCTCFSPLIIRKQFFKRGVIVGHLLSCFCICQRAV